LKTWQIENSKGCRERKDARRKMNIAGGRCPLYIREEMVSCLLKRLWA